MKWKKIGIRKAVVLPALAACMVMLSCSADIFKKPQAPEIEELELSAYEVNPGETIAATVTVKDSKDQTLRYEWTADNGFFIPPTDKSQVSWKAPAVGGMYHIGVTVSNEDDKSASRSQNVTVRSFSNPSVKLLSPSEGSYFVQHGVLSVSARASHENGITRVDLIVNRIRKATLNGHPSEDYAFSYTLDEPSGPAVVKVEAVANVTGKTGADSARIFIEGVVLGKPAQ